MDQYANTAVYIKNASKSFGKKPVLQHLNMHVEKGIIYGLLGSSGCGKTVLLNCIVGRRQLDSGTVWALGGPPGTIESGVPGRRVGYMPQDISLIGEFTVKAAIYYFGRIFCMSEKDIKVKFTELTRLLDLPPGNRFIANCSGGQQRRVSFAAALISSPELLVLDEPTVGLDPLLRESIWDYLLKLTQSHLASVIITTHYIEEARQAHKIGLMRQGKLIAEESPEGLLNRFQTHSLEDAFLILSKNDKQGTMLPTESISLVPDSVMMDSHSTASTIAVSELEHSQNIVTTEIKTKRPKCFNTANAYGMNFYRIKALLGKSWLQVSKNYSGVGFMVLFPIFQILAFFLAVGDDVKGIKIAINNHENNFKTCVNHKENYTILKEDGNCKFQQLGCYFLQQLSDPMIDAVVYDDVRRAKNAIVHGEVTGALYIPENFTESVYARIMDGDNDNITLDSSQIQVWLDMSNRQVGAEVKAKLTKKMLDFLHSIYSDCNFLNKSASIPVNFVEYMYGDPDDTFRVFMAPCAILTSLYFLGSFNAAQLMLSDRLEGIWDRSIVAGVSTLEIVFVHFVTQSIIIVFQAILVLVITFPVYKTENAGSFVTVSVISFLSGVCGVIFGFLISVVSNGYTMAHIIATGTTLPVILLCGMMWPIEGMPKVLQWIALCLPVTYPSISLRNVMKKGWSILHKYVIIGVGVELLWIVIFGAICTLEIKRRR